MVQDMTWFQPLLIQVSPSNLGCGGENASPPSFPIAFVDSRDTDNATNSQSIRPVYVTYKKTNRMNDVAGRAKAVRSGAELRNQVAQLRARLGLEAQTETEVGRRLWGVRRRIDVILCHQETRKTLGVECKYQRTQGTAEQIIAATIDNIQAWPVHGRIFCFGEGFPQRMTTYLLSTGDALQMTDAEKWIEPYFGH